MSNEIEFRAELICGEDWLTVRYEVTNRCEGEVGLLNALFGRAVDGTMEFSPDHVYVDLKGRALHLVKGALPIPKGLNVNVYIPPYARRLAAGAAFAETFRVPVPVKVREPFKARMIDGEVIASRPAVASSVTVSIGVVMVSEDRRLVAEHPAYPDVCTVFPPEGVLPAQALLSRTFELAEEIPVLDYEGHPWS